MMVDLHSHMHHAMIENSSTQLLGAPDASIFQSEDHEGMDHGGMDHGGMDHGGMNHGGMHHGGMMMQMYFHFTLNDYVLFEWWKVDSKMSLIFSMLGIFVIALIYEALKFWREYLYWKNYTALQYQTVNKPPSQEESERVINNLVSDVIHRQPPKLLSKHHILQTCLHVIQIVISYFLMLIFMTYNVWLCLAVTLGSGTGYFLFGWRKSLFVDITEHCH